MNRGLIIAAGVVVSLMAAPASIAADDGLSLPAQRFAGSYELPVLIPENSSGPENMLRNPLEEVSATLLLDEGFLLQSGFNVDVGRVLEGFTPSPFDGLFYSPAALGSSYTSLANGGEYFGLGARLMEGLTFSIGHAASSPGYNRYLIDARMAFAALGGHVPYDYRNTNSLVAGMSWDFARWGGINFTAARTAERNPLGLGSSAVLVSPRTTSSLGVSARVGLGGGWVTTASYSEGLTQLELRPAAFSPDASLRTESYGVAVAKHGLFSKHDALGLALARPAPNFSGSFASDKSGELQFFGRDKLLGLSQETDIELGYKTEFFGDSIALQANASYQMNYGGVNGNNAVQLLSRAKIKF